MVVRATSGTRRALEQAVVGTKETRQGACAGKLGLSTNYHIGRSGVIDVQDIVSYSTVHTPGPDRYRTVERYSSL